MSFLLGIDSSTTATKALLADETGGVVAVASSEVPLSTPRPLWAEQDPILWWEATRKSLAEVLAASGVDSSEIAGVGLTGQMHGLVLLDGDGEVLRPAILWNDQRSAAECDEMRETLGLARLVEITGNDAFPGFTAPKLLWVRRHEPEIYAKVRQVLLPKDYVRYRLTGGYATDRAGAGGTLMLDLETRDWSNELLDTFDIPHAWLPRTHEGSEITGRVSREAAELTGLAAGTPVMGGGGDQAAQAVGVGAVEPGVVALTLGTSGVVFASVDRPLAERRGRLHAFPHAVPDMWHVMGVMLSAAGSLRWYRTWWRRKSDSTSCSRKRRTWSRVAKASSSCPISPVSAPHTRTLRSRRLLADVGVVVVVAPTVPRVCHGQTDREAQQQQQNGNTRRFDLHGGVPSRFNDSDSPTRHGCGHRSTGVCVVPPRFLGHGGGEPVLADHERRRLQCLEAGHRARLACAASSQDEIGDRSPPGFGGALVDETRRAVRRRPA